MKSLRILGLVLGVCLVLALAAAGWIAHLVATDKAAALADCPGLVFHWDGWEADARHGIILRYRVEGGDFSYAVWKMLPEHQLKLWQ